jgi:hypothetical protein
VAHLAWRPAGGGRGSPSAENAENAEAAEDAEDAEAAEAAALRAQEGARELVRDVGQMQDRAAALEKEARFLKGEVPPPLARTPL